MKPLSLSDASERWGLGFQDLIDAIVDDALVICRTTPPKKPGDLDYYVTTRSPHVSLGSPRGHLRSALTLIQDSLDGWRKTARDAEATLATARQEIAALETLAERMAQRLEALLLQAQQQERLEKATATGQPRKIVLDPPKRTPVA